MPLHVPTCVAVCLLPLLYSIFNRQEHCTLQRHRRFASCRVFQVTDGAAAVLLMTRREALNRNLPILGIFRSFAAVGVDPAVMGIGPAVAIPAALKMAGLTTDDIDLYELNEAFASQVCIFLLFSALLQA